MLQKYCTQKKKKEGWGANLRVCTGWELFNTSVSTSIHHHTSQVDKHQHQIFYTELLHFFFPTIENYELGKLNGIQQNAKKITQIQLK